MLKHVKAAVRWSLIVLWLAGCTNLRDDLPNWLKVMMVAAFLLAIVSAVVLLAAKQTEQRIAAGFVAIIGVVLGVMFLFVLIA